MTNDEAERIYIYRVAHWIDEGMSLPEAEALAEQDHWDPVIFEERRVS